MVIPVFDAEGIKALEFPQQRPKMTHDKHIRGCVKKRQDIAGQCGVNPFHELTIGKGV
jgi:hypothetical protein